MSGVQALAKPHRIKAAHRRRRKCASGQSVQRYYDPGIGRFLSVDPVTADSSTGANFNRYYYANNNPYKFTDPDGRIAVPMAAGGCGVTGPACPVGAVAGYLLGRLITFGVVALVMNEIAGDVAEPDPSSGSEKDSADKSGELTKAGRAQQKHGDREGSAFDPAKGSPAEKNDQGKKTLDSITNSPDKTTEKNHRGGTDVRETPDGRGARYDKEGKFTAFIEPRNPQP